MAKLSAANRQAEAPATAAAPAVARETTAHANAAVESGTGKAEAAVVAGESASQMALLTVVDVSEEVGTGHIVHNIAEKATLPDADAALTPRSQATALDWD